MHDLFLDRNNGFAACGQVLVTEEPKQNVFLYLSWRGIPVERVRSGGAWETRKGQCLLIRDGRAPDSLRLGAVLTFDAYSLVTIEGKGRR